MPHDVISTCPVCASELAVTRLHCRSCGTTLEGDFSVGRFGRLNREQLVLLESFLRSRGNLREMERELGISYPTVRSRVEALVRALGFGPRADSDEADDAAAERHHDAAQPRGDPPGPGSPRDERRRGGRRDPRPREDPAMTTDARLARRPRPRHRCRRAALDPPGRRSRSAPGRHGGTRAHPRRSRPGPRRHVRDRSSARAAPALRATGDGRGRRGRGGSPDLEIELPARATVVVESASGDIDVDGLARRPALPDARRATSDSAR